MTVALRGDLGKPRPAIVVETDRLAPTKHVIVCPGTIELRPDIQRRRLHVEPDADNGLTQPTQFQIDKITVTRREKCGLVIGRLDTAKIDKLNAALFLLMGLAD